ncbi:MAG: hypothetical protein V4857_02855 [Pseudomonadota bacterium]
MATTRSAARAAVAAVCLLLGACEGGGPTDTNATRDQARGQVETDFYATLTRAHTTAPALRALSTQAIGVLIFPTVITVNPVTAERTGFGALREGAVFIDHVQITASTACTENPDAAQAIIILFMSREALNRFRRAKPWKIEAQALLPEAAAARPGGQDVLFLVHERSRFVALPAPCRLSVTERAF